MGSWLDWVDIGVCMSVVGTRWVHFRPGLVWDQVQLDPNLPIRLNMSICLGLNAAHPGGGRAG